MYILKNALRNISRAKGRNILISIIVFVIAVSSCVALSIRQAANRVKEDSLSQMEITATISVDRTSMMQGMREGTGTEGGFDRSEFRDAIGGVNQLSLDEMLSYAELDSVKDFYYTLTVSFNGTDDIEPVQSDTGETDNQMGNIRGLINMGDFTVVGYSSDIAMTDFLNGVCSITEGTMFTEKTDEMVCVISEELALYNSIEAGDIIVLANPNDEDEIYELTVTGIYSNNRAADSELSPAGGFFTSTDPANYIYTSYNTLKAITTVLSQSIDMDDAEAMTTALREQISGTYLFATLEDYEAFEALARKAGLSEQYRISSTDAETFQNSLLPLENTSKFSVYFLMVVLIIGGIILVVLNIFNIRERKYEIGVLTAIGMKKPKVAMQFITEIFAVTIAAVIIGTVAGAIVSVPVGNKLHEMQVEAQEQNAASQEQAFGRQTGARANFPDNLVNANPASTTEYISEISGATDWVVILQLFTLGIFLTIVASFSAVGFIMRYEPLKILSNRD